MKHLALALILLVTIVTIGCHSPEDKRQTHSHPVKSFKTFVLDFDTPTDPELQAAIEKITARLREKYQMADEDTQVGLLDLKKPRLALIHPDQEVYAASVAKIGILLAYFQLTPSAATNIQAEARHELGLMAKISSNEMAAKYSKQLTLKKIQEVLNSLGFYDTNHGGGIWMGKHYGEQTERIPSPISKNVHAITVRQVLRFFLLLKQEKLLSPEASRAMREIFASPDIPHDQIKFVKGLADRNLDIIRKWGSFDNSFHDAAVIKGPNRYYILVGLSHHPKGDEYLEDLARAVDDLMNP